MRCINASRELGERIVTRAAAPPPRRIFFARPEFAQTKAQRVTPARAVAVQTLEGKLPQFEREENRAHRRSANRFGCCARSGFIEVCGFKGIHRRYLLCISWRRGFLIWQR